MIHACDFWGTTKPFLISKRWSDMVSQEFASQYEYELQHNMPCTPFYKDLYKLDIRAKGEIGFINFIVKPLWRVMNIVANNDF